MPDLNLEPSEVREIDPKTGRDKRDNSPAWYRNWFLVCLVPAGWIFLNRDALASEPAWFFVGSIGVGLCAGIFLHGWGRHWR